MITPANNFALALVYGLVAGLLMELAAQVLAYFDKMNIITGFVFTLFFSIYTSFYYHRYRDRNKYKVSFKNVFKDLRNSVLLGVLAELMLFLAFVVQNLNYEKFRFYAFSFSILCYWSARFLGRDRLK